MQKFIGIGTVGKDVKLDTTTSGTSVLSNSIAIQRKYKNKDNEYETDWINLVFWRSTAEYVSKYIKKGDKIAVVGTLQTRSYDAQDGSKRYVSEIVCDEVEKLNWEKKSTSQRVEKLEPIEDSSLPF
jgi:single-strand DNA-binding protein